MLLAPLFVGRPRIVWVYLGQSFAALPGVPFKLFARSRLVFTCADLWPESLLAAGVVTPGLKTRALFAYRRAVNRVADAIICATRGTRDKFASEAIPRDRLHYVPVWVPQAAREEPNAERASRDLTAGGKGGEEQETRPRIVYAGNIGPAQRLDTVILAAFELQREAVPVVFELYGDGSEVNRLRRLAAECSLKNIRFCGRVSPAASFQASASAFGQIVALEPSPLFDMTVPSKLSACFAAGAPLLYGLRGEAFDLAREADGGFAYDAANPASLAAAVRELLRATAEERKRMSGNLRRFYSARFDHTALLERTVAVLIGDCAEERPDTGQEGGAACSM